MHNLTKAEEDYIKAIFTLSYRGDDRKIGVNELAEYLSVSPASVNSMVKKLRVKELIENKRYSKLNLSDQGKETALSLIRKHRLWETFLYKYLNFSWDEVHAVAEQLEHIKSVKLIDELDRFMKYPATDPHGDPIPQADGTLAQIKRSKLSALPVGSECTIVSVRDGSVKFLQYISELGLVLSSQLTIERKRDFDGSIDILSEGKIITLSEKAADNIFVQV